MHQLHITTSRFEIRSEIMQQNSHIAKTSFRYDERLAEAKKIGIKKGVMRGGFQGVIWCALILTFALAFWYGSILVLDNQNGFTLGKLLTVIFTA